MKRLPALLRILIIICVSVLCAGLICGICTMSHANPSRLSRVTLLSHQFLFGHTDLVLAIAFSPDGKWLASGGEREHEIRIWDVENGEQIYSLTGHTAKITDLAFRINGDFASASEDGTMRLWNVSDSAEIRQFNGHKGAITSVAFSPDGKHLVSGSSDRTLNLWDADTGERLMTFEGHEGIVWSVAFSPDGETIVSASEDRTVRLWNAADGSLLKTFTGHTNLVWSVAYHPGGDLVASGGWDGAVRIWNVDAHADELALQEPFVSYDREVLSVEFSPNGRTLAVGLNDSENDNTLKLWELTPRRELRSFDTTSRHDLDFSPDGFRLAAAGAADGTITLWRSSHLKPALTEPGEGTLVETSQAILRWEAVENAVYYDVEIARNPDFVESTQLRTVTENELTFEISDETPSYWWRVRTGSFGGVGGWSESRSFRTLFEAPPACVARILPPRQLMNLEEEFSVQVVVDAVEDLAGFQFDLQWTNPDVLHLVTATEFRNIFGESGLGQSGEINREIGLFKDVVAAKRGPGGVSGSGILLAVLFSAKNPGFSDIQLDNLQLVNSKGEPIPCNVLTSRIVVENPPRPWDVNHDGIVNVFDLTAVARYFGQEAPIDLEPYPDINGDGVVDIHDITLVGAHFGESYPIDQPESAAPPSVRKAEAGGWQLDESTIDNLQRIYIELSSTPDNSPPFVHTRQVLRHLLSSLRPSQDGLFQNYPNPFNPETWIPFQLASATDVTIEIHEVNGALVRKLALGHLAPGSYESRIDAAYWDGKNSHGEPVASGIYFYTISTESFRATRKMAIAK